MSATPPPRPSKITTLPDVEARCALQEVPGCWMWCGACNDHGMPVATMPPGVLPDASFGIMAVRRVAWLLAGHPLPAGHAVEPMGCTNARCVNPQHAKAVATGKSPRIEALNDVLDRCQRDDETGCWVWRGSCTADGVPVATIAAGVMPDGSSGVMGVRRVAWLLAGRKLAAGQVVYQCGCDNKRCVLPEHAGAGTRAEAGAALRLSGRLRDLPHRRAHGVRSALNSPRTLSAEVVARIEAGLREGRLQRELAAEVGCYPTTICKVNARRHIRQRTQARGASVFSLAGASS